MTRSQATPESSQMITMARMIEERDDELHILRAENEALRRDAERFEEMANKLLKHLDDGNCTGGECYVCSEIVCPKQCELHFHHDGCPACAEADAAMGETK